jgi:glycosyltransferase involved in cell wall biosynthesis
MIHLVYPHGAKISAPDVIGHTLRVQLGIKHRVEVHDFDRLYRIVPAPGDILIGHAHPVPRTVFRRSVQQPGWARRILLEPFNADWRQVGFIDNVIDHCDLFLAITGRYWFEHTSGPTARWKPKMVHLDLAVDRHHFPRVRNKVAPIGERRFLYIGNDHPGKNLPYLDSIAGAWANGSIDWAGRGRPLANVRSLGFVDFSSPVGRELISEYDFLITVGRADANPTTVLEAMSWGLTPVCTPTSGYMDEPAIINVPVDDVSAAVVALDRLQQMDEDALLERRRQADMRLCDHYNWDRFVDQVRFAIMSDASPTLTPRAPGAPAIIATPAGALARLVARNVIYGFEERFPTLGLHGAALTRLRNWIRR